jgi:polyisoprenyl-teichoic acid--peptidoglycan teichoic acid transferase
VKPPDAPRPPSEGDPPKGAAGVDPAEEGNGAPGVPPPSTWAGRQRQGGEEAESAGRSPQSADGGDGAESAVGSPQSADGGDGAESPGRSPQSADGGDGAKASGDGEPASSAAAAKPTSRDTVEVDTLALADREAAQEAALAGLRARAAAHATQTDHRIEAAVPTPPPAPVAAPPPPAPPAAATPPPTSKAPAAGAGGVGEPPRRGLWARYVVGSLLIVISIATATAVSGVVFANDIAAGLGGLPRVQHLLQDTSAAGPQTILILGSDKRPKEGDHGRSDTTILLRVTPSAINLLSLPRDLKVNIPGHGPDRLNAAYTYGGPALTTKVVQQITGLPINHVVNIDFTGFADAVNAVGCVYFDVDHHYYHSNVGLPSFDQYAEINIHAGYQRMCGFNALQFVRYRHDDNDLVRSARQQAFLREARHQIPPTKLLEDYNSLVAIFSKYTTSDNALQDTGKVIGLAKLFFAARNAPVREIHFPAVLGISYVTASSSAIHRAVQQFLAEPSSPSGSASAGSGSGGGGGGGGSSGSGGGSPAPPPLTDSSVTGRQIAAKLSDARWRREGKIPMLYPTKLVPGSFLTSDSDSYRIDGPGDQIYDGYTFVAEVPATAPGYGYTAYYDFTGTNWPDPPILDSPTETKTINGHEFELFWDNGRLRLVGWKTSKGSYWVDNDLLETLSPGQMVAMAEAMRPYTG